MTIQDELYFSALTKDRAESADMLEKPSMRGIKKSVVDKYSDQAHFIYELLQNADDAKATTARFTLEQDQLIFVHNGTRHFSVSDPSNEEEDSSNGKLGDINAITSIANSNKTEASIGKFGVGFKAVFQYTSVPRIYDPEFRFKIDRFIVPIPISDDYPSRKKNETLFVFPFNHSEKTMSEAYDDISDKLRNLSYPLLFLTELKEIEFVFNDVIGLYEKSIKKSVEFENTIAEYVCLTQNSGDEIYDENLWLFTRKDDCGRNYSVGFFIDSNGKLTPKNVPAFCFFPTKEVTGLNFIIHAPFLLTDSREGIRAGVPHNNAMINNLAELAADALEYLRDIGLDESVRIIDDNIVKIIPYDPNVFSNPNDKRKVSFSPFHQAIKKKFQECTILPSLETYTTSKNAYWASVPQLTHLFSNSQLAMITDNESACWVFPSLGRDETRRNNSALFSFIESLSYTNIDEDAIINGRYKDMIARNIRRNIDICDYVPGISADFIEKQSFEWLHAFYKWLSETSHRTSLSKDKPLFLDQDRKAVSAYDEDGKLTLFFQVEGTTSYTVVHSELINNSITRKYLESIGVREPSLKDQIYNVILPQYKSNEGIETAPHFEIFFKYYCKCPNEEVYDFINLIRGCEFINYYYSGDTKLYRGRADSMYIPTEELTAYFETNCEVRFIDIDEYRNLVDKSAADKLMAFLVALGVRREIRILNQTISPLPYKNEYRYYMRLPRPYSTRGITYEESIIEGCKELVDYIVENHSEEKSRLLWSTLLRLCGNSGRPLLYVLQGKCKYFYYTDHTKTFPSSDVYTLKESAWILNIYGEFVSPSGLNLKELSDIYDTSSIESEHLIEFLGIQITSFDEDSDNNCANYSDDETSCSHLSEAEQKKIHLANKLIEAGIDNEEELELALNNYRANKHKKETNQNSASVSNQILDSNINTLQDEIDEQLLDSEYSGKKVNEEDYFGLEESIKSSKSESSILGKSSEYYIEKTDASSPSDFSSEDNDEDDYIPRSVDYSRKIEREKKNSTAEIEKIAYLEELNNKAIKLTQDAKYTLAWFNTLLELESRNSGETNSNSKEVSISFACVERDQAAKRTLILKHPSQYIPQFMEDLADIPLVLHMGDQSRTIAIEVASIKSYTLHVKMKSASDIDGIDLKSVTSASINARSPAFLLEELRKQFACFDYSSDFNLKTNLCENIDFIFGPPGTGKTTYIANHILLPLMSNLSECKVLVLTPTNKAADVLVRRIMDVSGNDKPYLDWLVRFGGTSDDYIEQSSVYKDKTFDIRSTKRNVTVTTIARFPYDYFMPEGARIYLNGINWDYIIIDEASMIPIANIIYPLYKKTPKKFIIAGDPFQIEPIASVDLWKSENIYTMVKLNSFVNPRTEPHQYNVKLLTTQYRSIPAIGDMFSNFAYGGILKHYRSAESQRPLNISKTLGIETLNIIRYPVSKYESIYRSKRLNHSSSYHIYSALFVFEYVCYLVRAISSSHPEEPFKIGIIAPYRAQADMIDKLIASEPLPDDVDVFVGTIHSFQGDECDIIFAVFNTPPSITDSKEMFLNKRNIINVSISRAKDYLFVVMPDENTENISNLYLVKQVINLIKNTSVWREFSTSGLEKIMFGDTHYLENNTFSTGHQFVNVYGLPERRYEVRAEDNAVDIQIHNNSPANEISITRREQTETSAVDSCLSAMPLPKRNVQQIAAKCESESNVVNTSNKESLIPIELQQNAVNVKVFGAHSGKYYLVPYNGKLKFYTSRQLMQMFIPQTKFGKEKLVPVAVDMSDMIIYISKANYDKYKDAFTASSSIELRTTFFH